MNQCVRSFTQKTKGIEVGITHPAFENPSLPRSDGIRKTHVHHGFRVVGRARRRFTRGYIPQPLRGHNRLHVLVDVLSLTKTENS